MNDLDTGRRRVSDVIREPGRVVMHHDGVDERTRVEANTARCVVMVQLAPVANVAVQLLAATLGLAGLSRFPVKESCTVPLDSAGASAELVLVMWIVQTSV